MSFIAVISASLTAALGLLTILHQIFIWQIKEYRLDRMRAHFFSPAGSIENHPWIIIFTTLLGVSWILLMAGFANPAELCAWLSIGSLIIHHAARIHRQGILRPAWTDKSRLIALTAIAASLVYYKFLFSSVDMHVVVLQHATYIFFLPVIVYLAILLTNPVTQFRKNQIISRAAARRKQLNHITVIGITGSFGKTSTKYFLQQLLKGEDTQVIATKAHRNDLLPVAQDILEQFPAPSAPKNSTSFVYITEMGAYARGEIAALAKLVRPNIGVITTIGNQHLDLFGSKENILKAKWELIQNLSTPGIAVLNQDDELLAAAAKKTKRSIVWYSTMQKADVYMSDIQIHPEKISGVLNLKKDSQKVVIPLAGSAGLNSVVAAAAAAYAYGTSKTRIFARIQHVKPFEHTMEIRRGLAGSTIIDDSYSAGEASVMNALEHLKLFPQKDKRVILVPLIELGKESAAAHEKIGRTLAETGADIFIYGTAHKADFQKGLRTHDRVHWFTHAGDLQKAAAGSLTRNSVVLLEGRIPDIVRQAVLSPNS